MTKEEMEQYLNHKYPNLKKPNEKQPIATSLGDEVRKRKGH